jgi:hypothetical protein
MPLASTTTCPALVAAVLSSAADAGALDPEVPVAEVAGAGEAAAVVAEAAVVPAAGAGVVVPLPPAQPETTTARARADRVAPKCFVIVGS